MKNIKFVILLIFIFNAAVIEAGPHEIFWRDADYLSFHEGNYCNTAIQMQMKLFAWREEFREDTRYYSFSGFKMERIPLKEGKGALSGPRSRQPRYGAKFVGRWTDKDQRQLERKIKQAEQKCKLQLKHEIRRAKKQVEKWPAEWEQKQKELSLQEKQELPYFVLSLRF